MDKANRLLPCLDVKDRRGGKRKGAGRPKGSGKFKHPTVPVRVPTFLIPELGAWIAARTAPAGQPPAQSGVGLNARAAECARAAQSMALSPLIFGDKAKLTLWFKAVLEHETTEANAVIAELVEALEAAIAYIGGNSVVGNQFLDLLEATQSRARAYIGKADS